MDRTEAKLHIGIIRVSSIGDVVLASSLLDFLQQLPFPTAVHWFGSAPSSLLIATAYPQVSIHLIKEPSFQVKHALAGHERLDLLVDLQGSFRSRKLSCPKMALVRGSEKVFLVPSRLKTSTIIW